MSKTDAINVSIPPDTGESPALGAARIRTLARGIIELFSKCGYVGSATGGAYTEDDAGEFIKMIMRATTKPSFAAGKGEVYVKDVGSGVIELFYEDAAGNEVQITTAGMTRLRSSDYTLANNTFLKALNASGTATVDMMKITTGDIPVLGTDTVQTPTNAAPTDDKGIANKKYIDDQITSRNAYVKVRDLRNDNTAGYAVSADDWRTITLDNEESDVSEICALSANRVTLAAGTYECRAVVEANGPNIVQLRLRNVTDSETILLGNRTDCAPGTGDSVSVSLSGKFTIAASKEIELQIYADDNFIIGPEAARTFGEQYSTATLEFWKRTA